MTVFCQPAAPFLSGFYDLVKKKRERQVPLFNTPQSPNKITYAVVNIIPKIVKLKVAA